MLLYLCTLITVMHSFSVFLNINLILHVKFRMPQLVFSRLTNLTISNHLLSTCTGFHYHSELFKLPEFAFTPLKNLTQPFIKYLFSIKPASDTTSSVRSKGQMIAPSLKLQLLCGTCCPLIYQNLHQPCYFWETSWSKHIKFLARLLVVVCHSECNVNIYGF